MEKLNKSAGISMDIVADNIAKLKELFPEILAENKIDFKALQALLGEEIEVEDERYSFNWHGKAQARRLAQSPSTGTLRPCKEESVDWDSTQNLFIEGDNLEVLKLLQKSYHKQVKMIYIDPPYNTGGDFVYPDNFKDNIQNYLELTGQTEGGKKISPNTEASGRYHTDWLNMMYPRLKLARNLLRDDGCVFISIDDNEQSNLKRLCDEIFGEENFIGIVCWKNKYGAGAKTRTFIEVHEYILCYSKTAISDIQSTLSSEQMLEYEKNKDDNYSLRGGFITQPLMTSSLDDRKTLQYEITYCGEIIKPRKQWVWSKERLEQAINNNEVVFKKMNDGTYSVRAKVYLKDENGVVRKGKPLSFISGPYNQEGTQEVAELVGERVFSFPKPLALVKKFLEFTVNNTVDQNDIILDFFSGSATTAHAVMQLNVENGSHRKFIMVQLPEVCDEKSEAFKAGYKTISEIGKERIRQAGQKIKKENVDYQGDLGFKVFRLDSSNLKPWDADFDSLSQDLADATEVIKADRKPEDVLFEILLKYGLDLTLPIDKHTIAGKTVYEVGAGALIVCLDDGVTEAVAEGIGKLKEQLEPEVMRVVFKDSSFASDAAKVNAVQVLKQYGIDDVKSI
jgi:adenine-specific DNA-methyltransferase